jgi:hypothetical protein
VNADHLLEVIDEMEHALAEASAPFNDALVTLQATLSKGRRLPFFGKTIVSDATMSSALDVVRALQQRNESIEPDSATALARLLTELRRRINQGTVEPSGD